MMISLKIMAATVTAARFPPRFFGLLGSPQIGYQELVLSFVGERLLGKSGNRRSKPFSNRS
jgi:hypothetical protein